MKHSHLVNNNRYYIKAVVIAFLFLTVDLGIFAQGPKLNAQDMNDWENPDVNGINKERPHAYSFLAGEKASNPMVQSLNGIWKFKWSPDPQSRPADFYRENYSTENWNNILVPGNWELQGFGTPIYVNIAYPFKRDFP